MDTAIMTHVAEQVDFVAAVARNLQTHKFTEADVDGDLYEAASIYAYHYEGDFQFMRDMHDRRCAGKLTTGMAKGVLNCMLADARRARAATASDTGTSGGDVLASFAGKTLPDGIYAVPVNGRQYTVKIEHPNWGSFDPGDQVVSMPGQYRKWDGFATLKARGGLAPWKSRLAAANGNLEALQVMYAADDPLVYGFAYSLLSGNCFVCNAPLDDPVSVKAGIGPVCAKRLGINREALTEDEAFNATVAKLVQGGREQRDEEYEAYRADRYDAKYFAGEPPF